MVDPGASGTDMPLIADAGAIVAVGDPDDGPLGRSTVATHALTRSQRRREREAEGPRFAHASEAELARILDFYRVRWEYEPRTFPVLWNLEGKVVESFSPDFYLPDIDLWVELTTLRQSLVRKKNRKLRRMRELYPMLRLKLLYARDFRALMLKYGRLDIAASLIGTDGQVTREVDPEPMGASIADVARSEDAATVHEIDLDT
jgi:hypoxanthine phosphoribosyltransferase